MLPRRIHEIAQAIADAGGQALVVGGFVRDRLLGVESKDFDLEIYGLRLEALRARALPVGPGDPCRPSIWRAAGQGSRRRLLAAAQGEQDRSGPTADSLLTSTPRSTLRRQPGAAI